MGLPLRGGDTPRRKVEGLCIDPTLPIVKKGGRFTGEISHRCARIKGSNFQLIDQAAKLWWLGALFRRIEPNIDDCHRCDWARACRSYWRKSEASRLCGFYG